MDATQAWQTIGYSSRTGLTLPLARGDLRPVGRMNGGNVYLAADVLAFRDKIRGARSL